MNVVTMLCRDEHRSLSPPNQPGTYIVQDLCHDPRQIGQIAADADRLVLALHQGDYDLSAVQTAARAAGVDPLGLQIISMLDGDETRFGVVLAGARARAAAFAGSEPEHARPSFPERLSRRSLLTVPKPEYEPVPLVDLDLCAAGDGCRACVDVCPQTAYAWRGRAIVFDKDVCVPCGRCVTTCPTGAIDNPAATPRGIRAQVAAIIAAAGSPPGIVFACKRRTRFVAHVDWYEIEVPCTAMVPGTWILAALLEGAAAATALPCTATGCPLEQDDVTRTAVDFARAAVAATHTDTRPVPDGPVEIQWQPFARMAMDDPFGLHGPAEVMMTLASAVTPSIDQVLEHAGSPIGEVTIDPEVCTLCTMCSQTCPTGALDHHQEDDWLVLTFDPTLCTACGQCVPTCPEVVRGAIDLRTAVDYASMRRGRHTVTKAQTLTCESCGRAIAPSPMMDRIGNLLGEEYAATTAFLSRRCMDCRGAG